MIYRFGEYNDNAEPLYTEFDHCILVKVTFMGSFKAQKITTLTKNSNTRTQKCTNTHRLLETAAIIVLQYLYCICAKASVQQYYSNNLTAAREVGVVSSCILRLNFFFANGIYCLCFDAIAKTKQQHNTRTVNPLKRSPFNHDFGPSYVRYYYSKYTKPFFRLKSILNQGICNDISTFRLFSWHLLIHCSFVHCLSF